MREERQQGKIELGAQGFFCMHLESNSSIRRQERKLPLKLVFLPTLLAFSIFYLHQKVEKA
jgi:hypothetical protein